MATSWTKFYVASVKRGRPQLKLKDSVSSASAPFKSMNQGLFFPEPSKNTVTASWKFSEVFKPKYLRPKIPSRFKRSTDNPTNPVPNYPPTKSKIEKRYSNLELVGVKPEVLYRHPGLSVEDQSNPNFESKKILEKIAVPSESFRRVSPGLKEPIRVLPLPTAPKPIPYTKTIENCNETLPSEISDLNLPLNPKKFLGRIVIPEADPHRITLETKQPNGTYVNLQDHQAVVSNSPEQGNPPDTPPYNPANIPYVEVPDYTDRREESLDGSDRLSKDKYTSDSDLDNDAVDPGTQPNAEGERSSPFGGSESNGTREDLNAGKKITNDSADTYQVGSAYGKIGKDSEVVVRSEEERPIKNSSHEDKGEEPSGANFYAKNITGSAEYEPVSFDIEDYSKPFDLDKFIDELFHRDERKSEELRVKASRKSRDESEDDFNARKFDDFYNSEEDRSRSDRSKDYFESHESKSGPAYAAVDDFQANHSTDVIKKFSKPQIDGGGEQKINGQSVSKFLSKLSQHRVKSDKVKGNEEDKKGKYHKHWILEYGFPSTKVEKKTPELATDDAVDSKTREVSS
ncbi:uncharacterized protein LOC107043721 [Diachasma alloeum]|uniref:uncharacterized protein LOC107043721 n=1 Tax=Diachasma alloeum TaxID=454923 RepID=UPI00073848C1|nr:uncharacterized protein LOC107043721 [Diachasma alloeum]